MISSVKSRVLCIAVAGLFLCGRGGLAGADDPVTFFTNVADRLLRTQLDLSVHRIPVYPTNEYSVEVHRLLQVAANLYDASHSDPFPSVFRPVSGADPLNPGGIAITNFVYDVDAGTVRDWLATNYHYGIPMVIGAKKGIPNFNEYVVQTTALAARKLEVTRATPTSTVYQTNQMWVLGISNFFGLEAWNSYTNALSANFPGVSNVTLEAGVVVDITITNNDNPPLFYSNQIVFGIISNIVASEWSGYRPYDPISGFLVPIYTNMALFTNVAYRTLPSPHFEVIGNGNFDVGAGFPLPEWILSISNRITYFLHANGRLLDFVHLAQLTNTPNLSQLFIRPSRVGSEPTGVAGCWNTNRVGGATSRHVPTLGIIRQLQISVGDEVMGISDWRAYSFTRPADINVAIGKFRAFMGLPPRYPYPSMTNSDLRCEAGFSPARRLVETLRWQVNDPLVHQMVEHFIDGDPTNNITTFYVRPFDQPVPFPTNLNVLNIRYKPWNGNPTKNPAEDLNSVNLGVKDAGIFKSDDWNFPTNLLSDPGRIGQVHRGTPWQTIYLKSEVATPTDWQWNWWDQRSHPTNDWRTVGLLLPLLVTNDVRGLLSVNETNEARWRQALHGITVWSNAVPPDPCCGPPQFETHTMHSNSPQAELIARAVQETRASRTPAYFGRLGDVLSTPELTVASPWLNRSDPNAFIYGLTDEAYEKIPEQLLLRLRGDPLLFIERNPSQTTITVEAYEGYSYEIQRSVDLQNWETLETVAAEEPIFSVSDSSGAEQRFYRAVLLP